MAKRKRNKITIGRRDKISLPELELEDLDAKVDTGAYTSSLHVKNIKEITKKGEAWVRFKLKHPHHPAYNNKQIKLPIFAHKPIKNSFGEIEKRYIIKTHIVIFGKSYLTEFSLADRSQMECPVLLGRKFLYRKFMVDVDQKDLSYKRKLKQNSPPASI